MSCRIILNTCSLHVNHMKGTRPTCFHFSYSCFVLRRVFESPPSMASYGKRTTRIAYQQKYIVSTTGLFGETSMSRWRAFCPIDQLQQFCRPETLGPVDPNPPRTLLSQFFASSSVSINNDPRVSTCHTATRKPCCYLHSRCVQRSI